MGSTGLSSGTGPCNPGRCNGLRKPPRNDPQDRPAGSPALPLHGLLPLDRRSSRACAGKGAGTASTLSVPLRRGDRPFFSIRPEHSPDNSRQRNLPRPEKGYLDGSATPSVLRLSSGSTALRETAILSSWKNRAIPEAFFRFWSEEAGAIRLRVLSKNAFPDICNWSSPNFSSPGRKDSQR